MIRIQKVMIVDNEHLYGPRRRLLIYLKGCSIHCEGCINPHLWSFDGGTLMSESEIKDLCLKENVEGITVHGGEPLDQADELEKVVDLVKQHNLTVILFTGYLKKELNPVQQRVWNKADLVVAGRFVLNKRDVCLQFRGSTNQRIYRHKGPYENYIIKDGYTTAIISIDDNGSMDVNGFLTDDISKLVNGK